MMATIDKRNSTDLPIHSLQLELQKYPSHASNIYYSRKVTRMKRLWQMLLLSLALMAMI